MQVLDIVARWPGSVHDSRIFNASRVRHELENGMYPGYLLGDCGYACKKYLLTPLRNVETTPEKIYQKAHIKTRNLIERFFGTHDHSKVLLLYNIIGHVDIYAHSL